ncbi:hypothetical protein BD413DRAFT_611069 [Trametes elegans]|nr:hypothetical protein BD413DRAFT_611069 [Trametes elegans]
MPLTLGLTVLRGATTAETMHALGEVEDASEPSATSPSDESNISPPTRDFYSLYGTIAGRERAHRLFGKRSPSPIPDHYDECGHMLLPDSKRAKRRESSELVGSAVHADDVHWQPSGGLECSDPHKAKEEPTIPSPKSWCDVPGGVDVQSLGSAESGIRIAISETDTGGISPGGIPTASKDTALPNTVAADWLLDPALSSSHEGMLVEVRGSKTYRSDSAWHGGDYEGARGVVLSVFNTGARKASFPSTRVRFLEPLDYAVDTYAVPVSILSPVRPDSEGQNAAIVGGEFKGCAAELLEEVSGGWFVAAAYDYFEASREDLVRLMPVRDGAK